MLKTALLDYRTLYAIVIIAIIDDDFLILFIIILRINLQLRWQVTAVDVRRRRPLKVTVLILELIQVLFHYYSNSTIQFCSRTLTNVIVRLHDIRQSRYASNKLSCGKLVEVIV